MSKVVVIGAGVIGCAIGWELARAGAKPTVLDREGAVGHGSTAASCGIVRCFYSTPTMTAMAHEGAAVWADWAAHLDARDSVELARFERPGMPFIPPELNAGIERTIADMQEIGVAVELLTAREVAARFPFLDTSSHWPIRRPDDDDFLDATGRPIAAAVFEPDAGYVVSPQLATSNLHAVGKRDGVEFCLGRGVVAPRHTI